MAAPALQRHEYGPGDARNATFARFVEAVEEGQSVRDACRTANISWRGVATWIADERNVMPDGTTFAARYARARQMSADGFAERALEAATDATVDDWQVRRLQVDTFKWRAAMANPKAYGARVEVEHSGTVGHLHLDALRLTSRNVNARNEIPSPDATVTPTIGIAATDTPIRAIPAETVAASADGPPSTVSGYRVEEGVAVQCAVVASPHATVSPSKDGLESS